jgi:hypothetical protein
MGFGLHSGYNPTRQLAPWPTSLPDGRRLDFSSPYAGAYGGAALGAPANVSIPGASSMTNGPVPSVSDVARHIGSCTCAERLHMQHHVAYASLQVWVHVAVNARARPHTQRSNHLLLSRVSSQFGAHQ